MSTLVSEIDYEALALQIDYELPHGDLVIVGGSIFDDDGKFLGAGVVKIVGEPTIVLNPSLNIKEKANVINELFLIGQMRASKLGIDKLVVFTDNPLYARFLKKRLGFNDKSGIGLQLEI